MANFMSELGPVEPKKLEGSETFQYSNLAKPPTVLSFWQWAYSNLPANNLRGHLAEFIVASAVGDESATRVEWADHDVVTQSGRKVEVKSAAYLQSWGQSKLSAISFDIAPAKGKDKDTESWRGDRIRTSDVYVFCLLKHKNKPSLDALNLEQWTFYVLPTAELNTTKRQFQKTLTLGSLLKLGPDECKYDDIAKKIDQRLGDARTLSQ